MIKKFTYKLCTIKNSYGEYSIKFYVEGKNDSFYNYYTRDIEHLYEAFHFIIDNLIKMYNIDKSIIFIKINESEASYYIDTTKVA